jgi:small subunit ribosomal protein S16
MLKIRLQRIGRKNEPAFRLVTVESRRGPKSGKNVEILGSYDPRRNRAEIKGERVLYWVSKGAKVSDTAHNLLIREKVITGKKIDVSAKSKKKAEAKTGGENASEVEKEAETKNEELKPEFAETAEGAAADKSKEEAKEAIPTPSSPTKSSEEEAGVPIPEGVVEETEGEKTAEKTKEQ